jgi:hypothetical protein
MSEARVRPRPALLLIALVSTLCAPSARAQDKRTPDGDYPERDEIHQSYDLALGAGVDISGIAGPVEIRTTDKDRAEVNIVRSAPTRTDLDCGKVVVEQTSMRLQIRSESLCPIVRGQQRVMLELPRRVDVNLHGIAGAVSIGPIDGMVRLDGIAGHVAVDELRAAKMSSLAGGLTMTVASVGDRGIRISSVTGGIDMGVRTGVNADVTVKSIVGRVRSDVSDARVSSNDDDDFHAAIGTGGPKIVIESVVGAVDIHRAR